MHGDECANQCHPHTSYTRRACCTLPVTRAGRVCASWTDHLSKCKKMFKLHMEETWLLKGLLKNGWSPLLGSATKTGDVVSASKSPSLPSTA